MKKSKLYYLENRITLDKAQTLLVLFDIELYLNEPSEDWGQFFSIETVSTSAIKKTLYSGYIKNENGNIIPYNTNDIARYLISQSITKRMWLGRNNKSNDEINRLLENSSNKTSIKDSIYKADDIFSYHINIFNICYII